MKQHKWHKEIKAWADNAEIQWKAAVTSDEWLDVADGVPMWHRHDVDFRIKPQPKEPQYLYVYQCKSDGKYEFTSSMIYEYPKNYIGKIKLEQDDE